jgi:hypothetical protein
VVNDITVQNVITIVMITALVISGIETALLNRIVKKRILETIGTGTKIQRGNWFYLFTRGMQPRPLRIPKPAPRRQKKKK